MYCMYRRICMHTHIECAYACLSGCLYVCLRKHVYCSTHVDGRYPQLIRVCSLRLMLLVSVGFMSTFLCILDENYDVAPFFFIFKGSGSHASPTCYRQCADMLVGLICVMIVRIMES